MTQKKSLIKGLAALQEAVDSRADRGPGAKWLKIAPSKSVKVWFLQELDEDAEGFDPDAGTAFIAVEHSAPKNYQRKAMCTAEDGEACLPCELNAKEPKTGWQQKMRLYANVLVDNGKDEPYVAVLSQGVTEKAITPALTLMAKEYGGVTGTMFSIKRNGEGKDTTYTIFPLPGGDQPKLKDYELYDLEEVVTRWIPYEEQAEFFEVVEKPEEEEESPEDAW
jgi:hypothetical protein